MPLVQTRGAASAQGFGEFAQAAVANYIEEVFSCFLYTGNGSTQTITNNIDLSTKGGLVWIKGRGAATNNLLFDTNRGVNNYLVSDGTNSQANPGNSLSAFNTTGFQVTDLSNFINENAFTYVSWTFREQPKFFDVVTYTGTGSNTTIAHSLGSVPGSIIVKRTDTTAAWAVYHRSLANTQYLVLNTTAAAATGATWWNSTTPTSAVFSIGTDASVNASGGTYVAYLFAHDAGGFGTAGTDNVISCGTFTGNTTVTLGYEPQWILLKNSGGVEDWYIHDTMRGWPVSGDAKVLYPNLSSAESATAQIFPNATGFTTSIGGGTYIYIAIRRGPMKVPTDATTVFKPLTYSGTGATASITGVGFPPSAVLSASRTGSTDPVFIDKLRGVGLIIRTPQTFSESNIPTTLTSFDQNGVTYGAQGFVNGSTVPYVNYMLQRAPSFFDEVCYTGTGVNRTITHNLAVVPELMIVKCRSNTIDGWMVYSATLPASSKIILNRDYAELAGETTTWNSTRPTASVFSVGTESNVNNSGFTYVNYLFATCAGVSKVGSYTGTGAAQTINCGFTAGVKFVLIKRTDSTGDWFYWDSARGIVAGDDPYLLLNIAASEITTTDYIDTVAAGFEITSTAPAPINANGGTFIFFAVS